MQISPIFNQERFTDNLGNPLAGGLIFAYEAGSTSVLQSTYSDQAGAVANPNPIVLDSSGKLPGETAIWLEPGVLYNLVLTAADGVTVIKSFDDVSGVSIPSSGGAGGGAIWIETAGATYLSPTSFLVPGNVTGEYAPGNRARLTLAGGAYSYGTVTSSSFAGGNTTVVITNDSTPLNASLEMAEYSVLIASGRTVDAGAVAFSSVLPYSTSGTVGWRIKVIDQEMAAIERLRARSTLVYTATEIAGVYTISPAESAGTYLTASLWTVRFLNASPGTSTLTVIGMGTAKPLKQFTASGALIDAVITAGMVTDVAWNNAEDCWIVLDALPATSSITPRGIEIFSSNGTFTTPAGVYYIKVTCVGGGGGGGAGDSTYDGGDSGTWTNRTGGGGGGGAVAWTYISTTPSTNYAISIGAGGAGGTSNGYGTPTPATAGGTTTFGVTTVTAQGGFAGGNASGSNWGAGGAGGGAGTALLIRGANGTIGSSGGTGGWSPGYGAPSREYGGGGTGGGAIGGLPSNGQNGFAGLCVVEW